MSEKIHREQTPKRAYIVTLGCPKNEVDSEGVQQMLQSQGYEMATSPDHADLLIVNTCGFIDSARQESLAVANKLAKHKQKHQQLIVGGCLTERAGNDLIRAVPRADGFIGTRRWNELPQFLQQVASAGQVGSAPATLYGDREATSPILPRLDPSPGRQTRQAGAPLPMVTTGMVRPKPARPSVYIKLSEGCNHGCAFCTIPSFKGPMISRTADDILLEAESFWAQGTRELVLIAQDPTAFGNERRERNGLAQLVRRLGENAPAESWVRLMYAYPTQVTSELIEAMLTSPVICHYLDMPLQHAHPDTLKRMRRPADMSRTRTLLAGLRQAMPDIAIRTTFIVGYPGETEQEFQTLLDFMAETSFSYVAAFLYSPEPGTVAATLPDPVPRKVAQRRYDQLMELQQRCTARQNKALVGSELSVLIERNAQVAVKGNESARRRAPHSAHGTTITSEPHWYQGRSYRDAPEIDGSLIVMAPPTEASADSLVGRILQAKITGASTYDLFGEINRSVGTHTQL